MHTVTDYDAHSHARNTDPITSHIAADMAAPFVGTHCERIRACLKLHGPMTKDEIAKRTGLTPVQVDRRLPDLEFKGQAQPTGGTRLSHIRPPRTYLECGMSSELLWGLHVIGPDDVFAAPSFEDAESAAVMFNKFWREKSQSIPSDERPMAYAVVVIWDGTSENHAALLPRWDEEWRSSSKETAEGAA